MCKKFILTLRLNRKLKVIGIDPGLNNTGFGIILFNNKKIETIDFGVISSNYKDPLSKRLNMIYKDILSIIIKYSPDCMSIEEVFYSNNVKTTMKLGQARGAVLIAAAQAKVQVYEYSAKKIKLSLTGNGASHKDQVKFMVENLLQIKLDNCKNDVSDALAAAICHEQQFRGSDL